MRTSKDIYVNSLGQFILLGQNEQTREFIKKKKLKIWSGFDYDKQEWIFEGKKDTRTLEELKI